MSGGIKGGKVFSYLVASALAEVVNLRTVSDRTLPSPQIKLVADLLSRD